MCDIGMGRSVGEDGRAGGARVVMDARRACRFGAAYTSFSYSGGSSLLFHYGFIPDFICSLVWLFDPLLITVFYP